MSKEGIAVIAGKQNFANLHAVRVECSEEANKVAGVGEFKLNSHGAGAGSVFYCKSNRLDSGPQHQHSTRTTIRMTVSVIGN